MGFPNWMTFNEINFMRGWVTLGVHDAGEVTKAKAAHNVLVASAKAVLLGHEINPDFQIGTMIAYIPCYPLTCKPQDVWQAIEYDHVRESYMNVQCKGCYTKARHRYQR